MDFKPHEKQKKYAVEVNKEELILLDTIRSCSYGSVTAHIVAGKLVRTETLNSALIKDKLNEKIKIDFIELMDI